MIDCLIRFGASGADAALAVTGAIIFQLLPRGESPEDSTLRPVNVATVVALAGRFIDAS